MRRAQPPVPAPTLSDVRDARKKFREVEPRDLFYRAATELVKLARSGTSDLSLADALAVLLQTWNVTFYRFKKMDEQHLGQLSALLVSCDKQLAAFRDMTIDSLCDDDERAVLELFQRFAELLGPVGAAKALHLLASRFFPLWDNEIACHYPGCRLSKPHDGKGYWLFMQYTKQQIGDLHGSGILHTLKALDEYNYCRFTLPMLERKRKAALEKRRGKLAKSG